MNRAHIEQLWIQLLSGNLTPAEEAQLTEELDRNRLQRELLLRDGETDRTLGALACTEHTADAFTAQVLTAWQREQERPRPFPSGNGPVPDLEDDEPYVIEEALPYPQRFRTPRATGRKWTIAAALLLALPLLSWLASRAGNQPQADLADLPRKPRPEEPEQRDGAPPPFQPVKDAPVPPVGNDRPDKPRNNFAPPQLIKDQPDPSKRQKDSKPEAERVARLTQAEACHWKGLVPEEWLGTDVLQLLRGTATITFKDGAVVELQGPTHFELNSTSEALLGKGKLRVTVPEKAKDFRMQTPAGGTIAEPGTAFTLGVEENGAATITVEQGSLAFLEPGANGRHGPPTTLRPGDTRCFTVRPPSVPRNQRRFQQSLFINGKLVHFDNLADFEKAREKVLDEMQDRLRKPFGRQAPAKLPPLLGELPPPRFIIPDQRGERLGFHETMFIDGKLVEFTDPFEYQRAFRKQMMEQLRGGKK